MFPFFAMSSQILYHLIMLYVATYDVCNCLPCTFWLCGMKIEDNLNIIYALLAILLRARWICDGTAMRSPSKRFPRYDCFEDTWSRKMRFSLLSKFYLNRPQMRANVFYSRCGKHIRYQWCDKIYSPRGETRAVDETVWAAMMIWVFLNDYARRMRRLTIDISWIDRFFNDVIRRRKGVPNMLFNTFNMNFRRKLVDTYDATLMCAPLNYDDAIGCPCPFRSIVSKMWHLRSKNSVSSFKNSLRHVGMLLSVRLFSHSLFVVASNFPVTK